MEKLFQIEYEEFDIPTGYFNGEISRKYEGNVFQTDDGSFKGCLELVSLTKSNYPKVWLVNGFYDEKTGEFEMIRVSPNPDWSPTVAIFSSVNEECKGEWYGMPNFKRGSKLVRKAQISISRISDETNVESLNENMQFFKAEKLLTMNISDFVMDAIYYRIFNFIEGIKTTDILNKDPETWKKIYREMPGTVMKELLKRKVPVPELKDSE